MAKEFAETYLGPVDSITVNLQSIYNRAKSEIDSQIEKAQVKSQKVELVKDKTRAISTGQKNRMLKTHSLGATRRPKLQSKK